MNDEIRTDDEQPKSHSRRIDELNALEEFEAEKLAETSILALETKGAPIAKLLAALAFVHKRRSDSAIGKFTKYLTSSTSKDNISYLFSSDAEDAEDDAEDDDAESFRGEAPEVGSQEETSGPADAEGEILPSDGAST